MTWTQTGRRIGCASALLALVFLTGCSAESRRNRHLERGERYLALESYEEAIIEFANVLRSDPTNAVATSKLGAAHLKTGNLNAAFHFYRRAALLTPEDDQVQVQLAGLYVLGNEPDKAWDIGMAMLERKPQATDPLLLLVDAARGTNQIAEARQRLEAGKARFEDLERYYLAMGNLEVREGNLPAAEREFQEALTHNASSIRARTALGLLYQARGNAAESLQQFEAAVKIAPTNSMARVHLAEALFRNGQQAEARQMLKDVTTEQPGFGPGLAAAGKLALADHDVAACQQLVDRLLKQTPEHYDGLLLQGRLLLIVGKSREAGEIFRKLVGRNPSSPEVRFLLAMSLAAERDIDAALQELRLTLDQKPNFTEAQLLFSELQIMRGAPDQAIGMLEAQVKGPSPAPRALALLGAAYRMAGRPDDATEMFRKLVAAEPDNAKNQYLLGLVLREQDRPAEAEQAFESSLQVAPDYALAAGQLASMLMQTQDVQAAVARLQQQMERATNAPGLPFLLGTIYQRQGATNLAVAAFEDAIARAPGFVGAHLEISRIYLEQDRPQDALKEIESALARTPNHVPALMAAAVLQQEADNYTAARAHYEKILQLEPKNLTAANNLAYLLANKLNEMDAAFALATRAREMAPRDPYTADTLGWIVFQRGDSPWAVTLLRESLAQLKGQPEVQYHLACALLATGEEDEAAQLLRASTQSGTPYNGRDDALRLLAHFESTPARTTVRAELEQQRDALRQSAPTPATLVRLGRIEEELEGPAAALAQYEAALRLDARYLPALLAAATAHRQLGNLDDARKLAMTARDISPQNRDALFLLGQIAYTQGQHAWAYSVLKEAAGRASEDAVLQLELGLSAFALGRVAEAGAAFQEAARLDPDSDTVGRRAAICSAMLPEAIGQAPVERARAEIDAALRDWPDCLPALAASAQTHLRAGDQAAADAVLAQVNLRFPAFTPAIASRLQLLADRQVGSAEALALANRGRELAPDDADLAEAAGRIYYWAGKCDLATSVLKMLQVAGRQLTPESSYGLGLCLMEAGKVSDAEPVLQAALAAAPDHSLAQQARDALSAKP